MSRINTKIQRGYAWLATHLETYYLAVFGLYLASVTLQTTTFNVYYPHRIGVVIELLVMGLLVIKLIGFQELTRRQIVGTAGLLALVGLVTLMAKLPYLAVTGLLVVGARGVDFCKIVRVYLVIVGGILLVAFVAAELGWIQNITFHTTDGLRQSFGVVYTTDFAAHLFYLSCAYLYLRARRFRLVHLILPLLALGVIYAFTKTMTDTLVMIVLLFLYVIYIYRRQLVAVKAFMVGLRYNFLTMPIVAGGILWLSTIFNYQDRGLLKLNDLLSTRLALGNNALLAYGVKLFGQAPIPVNGWGGDRVNTFKNGMGAVTYFFIDSSYLNMLIAYGLVLTLVVVCGTSWFAYHRGQQHDYLLPVMLAVIALSSAFDQHLLEMTYNVFILAFFAKLPTYQTVIGPEFSAPAVVKFHRGQGKIGV
ncbi:polysaccharide biosynthesis protein [Lactiplantibacillus modestisalitolerans]|uniref:polysaccharide biosynthesis protein n=1 Tax=Lactiplantibacillus modestisalitolerans TaxID=1457219 RepID=UPI001CDD8B40|nr:polysaccharide biosynthesis protein [Lactiplantibacillus modestisalitolerans]